jgi:hypothetical protein
MSRAMHASALAELDMFADQEATGLRMQFTGTLKADAQLRCKPIGDDQHIVPVLCLDLIEVGDTGRTLLAQQIFTEATRKHAEALAQSLTKGKRVTLTTSLLDIRIFLPHVERIELAAIQPQPQPTH